MTDKQLQQSPQNGYPNKYFKSLEKEESKYWNFDGKDITDRDCDYLCKLWSEKHPNLAALVISRNKLTNKGLKRICEVLSKAENFESLDLGTNKFDPIPGMGCLAEALKTNSSLKKLALARCRIEDEALRILTEGLKCCKSITELDLRENNLSIPLKSNSPPCKGFQNFCEFLKKSESLIDLHLGGTSMEMYHCKALCETLKINNSLKKLHLTNNYFGSNEVKELLKFLETNKSIKLIELGGNSIGDKGVMILLEYLKKNISVRELSLCGNEISDKGCIEIAKVLEKNATLRKLYLEGNVIGVAWRRLLRVSKININLLDVTLDENPCCESDTENPNDILWVQYKKNCEFKDSTKLRTQTFVGHSLGHLYSSDVSLIFGRRSKCPKNLR